MKRLSQKGNKRRDSSAWVASGFSRRFSDGPASSILRYFFDRPRESVHGRELSRRLALSPATVFRALKGLLAEGWLVERRERHASYFSVRESAAFKSAKLAFTVSKIVDSGVLELVRSDSKGLHSFLLFGSAARGEDGPESDYDFLLVAISTKVNAARLSERLGRDVNLKSCSISEWMDLAKSNPAFYRDVLAYSWLLLGEKPVA